MLFTGLEQFVEELPSLINQITRQLDSDNIIILEHFERNLEDVFDFLKLETDTTQFLKLKRIYIYNTYNIYIYIYIYMYVCVICICLYIAIIIIVALYLTLLKLQRNNKTNNKSHSSQLGLIAPN